MKKRFGRWTAIALVAGASAAVLAGCASSRGSSATASSGVKTYSIAGLLDFSGPFASRGTPGADTAKLWLNYFNQTAGKKDNIKLTFKSYDSGYDPSKVSQVYPSVVQDSSVIGILGYGSPTIIALQNRLSQNKVPMVQSGTAYNFMNKGGWVFGPLGDPGAAWATGIKWYQKNVLKSSAKARVALVTLQGSSGQDFISGTKDALGNSENIVLQQFIPPTATSVDSYVDQIVAAKADVVVIGTTDALQPLLLKDLKSRHFDMTKIMTAQHESLSQMVALNVPSSTLNGIYEFNTLNYNDKQSEAYKIFTAAAPHFGSPQWNGSNQQISSGMIVLTQAVAKAAAANKGKTLTGQDVYNALNAGTFKPYGLTGTVTFHPNDRRYGTTVGFVSRFRNGAITTLAKNVPLLPLPAG